MADAVAYVTAAEIKSAAPNVFGAVSAHDGILEALAQRASRLIDGIMGYGDHAFDARSVASTRYYNGTGRPYCRIDPCVEVTSVAVKDAETSASYTAWTDGTDYEAAAGGPCDPDYNAGYYTVLLIVPGSSKVFTYGRKTVSVTARWGRTDTPPEVIKQAVIIQAVRWFKRGESMFSDTAGLADLGQLAFTKKLDPEIETIVLNSGYRRYTL